MKIGVICPSEIAIRRFMPALTKCKDFEFAGIGVYNIKERFSDNNEEEFNEHHEIAIKKAKSVIDKYGGKIYNSYEEIASSPEINALYIPLPPALHCKWAKCALETGKHVLLEKPSTTSFSDSNELINMASKRCLALHENYMFVFHSQINTINQIVTSGEIGEVRLYRICFGFPKRSVNDFRYNKILGGGALLDAGGYTIKFARMLLGETVKIVYAQSNYIDGSEVDMYGSAALVNDDGVTAQIAFGMDNNYKCELEVWGSHGCLITNRILTAPEGFSPTAIIRKGNTEQTITLPADDAFLKSIQHFSKCVYNNDVRLKQYAEIIKQAELVDNFKKLANWDKV